MKLYVFVYIFIIAISNNVSGLFDKSNNTTLQLEPHGSREGVTRTTSKLNETNKNTLNSTQLYTEGGVDKLIGFVSKPNPTLNKEVTSTEANVKDSKKLPSLLDTDIIGSAKSSITARKGVGVPTVNDEEPKHISQTNTTTKPKPTVSTISQALTNITASSTTKSKTESPVTEAPAKKPLVLYSSDIDDFKVNLNSGGPVRSANLSVVSAHPDLVIPVVITVFALPLFAVLGYYALKHGREAWKNRHYRRMDFLLDGMYND